MQKLSGSICFVLRYVEALQCDRDRDSCSPPLVEGEGGATAISAIVARSGERLELIQVSYHSKRPHNKSAWTMLELFGTKSADFYVINFFSSSSFFLF